MAAAKKSVAIITAATVEVQCPECGEPQPCPDNGSHIWTLFELAKASEQKRACTSCDAEFVVRKQSRVSVGY